jgi:hypothetical protein
MGGVNDPEIRYLGDVRKLELGPNDILVDQQMQEYQALRA